MLQVRRLGQCLTFRVRREAEMDRKQGIPVTIHAVSPRTNSESTRAAVAFNHVIVRWRLQKVAIFAQAPNSGLTCFGTSVG